MRQTIDESQFFEFFVALSAFCSFLSVFIISSSLFQFNEFSFAPENSTDRKFMIEVSDVPDFSYSLGSISFYDIKNADKGPGKVFNSKNI